MCAYDASTERQRQEDQSRSKSQSRLEGDLGLHETLSKGKKEYHQAPCKQAAVIVSVPVKFSVSSGNAP